MPITASLVMAGGSLLGSGISAFGSYSASKQQSDALKQALALQQQMFNTTNNALQPYIQGGQSALPTLQRLLTPGSDQTNALSQLPGFQFAQDWGQKAVQNIGSTTGLGGNVLTAGAKFATGTAQQGFGSYVDMLQKFANMGLTGGQSLAGAAQGFGKIEGDTLAGIGQAKAAGTLGITNALSGGAQGFGNALAFGNYFRGGAPANSNASGVYSGGNNALDYMAYGNPAGEPLALTG